MASWFWGREHLFGTGGLPWCWGAYPYPFGEVGGPVAAGVAGPVDGGLDVDAEQAGQYPGGEGGCPCGGGGVAGLPGVGSGGGGAASRWARTRVASWGGRRTGTVSSRRHVSGPCCSMSAAVSRVRRETN